MGDGEGETVSIFRRNPSLLFVSVRTLTLGSKYEINRLVDLNKNKKKKATI